MKSDGFVNQYFTGFLQLYIQTVTDVVEWLDSNIFDPLCTVLGVLVGVSVWVATLILLIPIVFVLGHWRILKYFGKRWWKSVNSAH